MIHKVRDWEAGESLITMNAGDGSIEAIERNAMQFLKDLHGSDPSIVTIAVQVHVEIMLNPDKQTKWTAEIPTVESAEMAYGEMDLAVKKLREDAAKKLLLEEETE